MSVSHIQKLGIVLGCIPGISIFVGFVKFFLYWSKEKTPSPKDREKVNVTAKKTDSTVKSNLKYYSLIQALPMIGIVGVVLECRELNKTAKKVMNFQPNPLGNITPDNDKAKVREVIETTPSEKLSITLTHHTHTITCEGKKETISTKKDLAFNRREFVKHVLSANPDFANAALLILTVCQNKLPFPKELSYSTYQGDLTALRNQPIHRGPLVMETAKEFFDYREDGDSYIDFANAFRFGGAWNTHGCVQEERMFAEFLELALLDFLTKGKVHPVLERNYFKPAPFVVEGIRRTFDISKTPYGTKFHGIRDSDTMKSMISEVQDSPRVNIVGLAALDYRSDSLTRGYNINHWYYHFDAFVLACMSGKRIHTADWGCGAFRGNVEAIIAIQYLASVVSNVPIVLHGVDNVNDKFKQENVEKAKGAVDALLGQGKTANEILNTLFNKHPEWKPRN